jgi:PAS domain S-box-containing protein
MHKRKRFVQHIIDASPNLISIYDVSLQKTVFANRSIATALGHAPQQDVPELGFIRSVIHPDDWQPLLDHRARLAELREEETAELEFRMRDHTGGWRWFHCSSKVFTRYRDGKVREIITTATDVTERKHAEEKSRFMTDLNQAVMPLADPEKIMAVAVRMLGEHLGADRCAYTEIEPAENLFVIKSEYTREEMRSILGQYKMSEIGESELATLRESRPYVINDIVTEAPPGTDVPRYLQAQLRAFVCVPLNKAGVFVARMAVHQKTPRRWSSDEIGLVTAVANRCWESVERARAVKRLQESDERYRAFIANSSEAIWRFELEQPIPVTLSDDDQLELLYKFAYLAECNDAMARMYGYKNADQILGARIGDLLVRSDPRNIAYLQSFKRSGYRLTDVESCEVDRYGKTKYFLNNLTGIQVDGAIVRTWGTQRDITDQKRAQGALRESEERLRRITDATQDALWEIDLETNQLWWSEGARPLFGRSPAELQIGLEDWYSGIHPDDVGRVRPKFEDYMRSGDSDWSDEYRFLRADGIYIEIHDQGSKFYDESGAPVRIAGAMADITNRKRAEEALRESEERYRLLTELSPDGVVIAGADGTIHLANPSMLQMLGAATENVVARNLFEFVAPEFLDHCQDFMNTLMTSGKPVTQVDAAFRASDGHSVPVAVSAVRLEWKGQHFAQIVIHDVSARKQAEAERERLLREIETERDRLRQILEQMPIGVSIAEAPSGRMVFLNSEAIRLLRHPLLPTENYEEFEKYGGIRDDGSPFHAEDYPMAHSLLSEEVVKGQEVRYRRGDASETVFSVDSAPIYDTEGRMVSAIATFIDIGERKLAENALRESEERFAKAFQASPDALIITRIADGLILEVNDSFVSLAGYERDEMIGKKTVGLGLFLDPTDRARMLAVLREKGFVRDFELAMKRKSGEARWILFSAQPLDLRGEHCWLTIGRDITDEKQVEQERERLLLQEKAAREEAEAASRMKDEFLATISHELRTPLTSILGWATMLTTGLLSESQTHHALEVIEQSAKSQARLVDDILDTSRIITGRLKLDAHPVDIEQVLQAAVDVVRPAADAKGIALRTVIDDHGNLVFGDTNRLQQVIWNLLFNSVKFTEEGGSIEARLSRSGNHVEISVTDTGIGIEPEFLPHVFDRFRQADSTPTRRYGGMGLGLAIVRHVVEMHGGSVDAFSEGKGLGSTFKVRFPVASTALLPQSKRLAAESAASPTVQPRSRLSQKLSGVRVLVVEDDRDTLEMLSFILDKSGAEVITAASARDAIQALDRWRPDALVSDLAMPEQDGYELIGQVRSRSPERGGNTPAVALSAYTRAEERTRALAAGFQMHLAKPVDPDKLVAVVADLTGLVHS